jgi:hypothetical protein
VLAPYFPAYLCMARVEPARHRYESAPLRRMQRTTEGK